ADIDCGFVFADAWRCLSREGGMNFLHPWALAGFAGIALPVIVHWLTKPRPVRLPLSTIRFVMQAVRQRRARYRLRDWIVLLLRAMAVMLIVWAFARPLWGKKSLMIGDEKGSTDRKSTRLNSSH